MTNPNYPRQFTLSNLELVHWSNGVITVYFSVEPSSITLYFHAEQDTTEPRGWKFTHHLYDAISYANAARDEFVSMLNALMQTPWRGPTGGSCKGRVLKFDRMSTNLDA